MTVRRRYIRSVDLARDVGDPGALEGYVVTPTVREAVTRILSGLSAASSQRAFRVVGPYGAGKSAFGVFLAQLCLERGGGPAAALLSEATGADVPNVPWHPVIVSGRRAGFSRELLRAVAEDEAAERRNECPGAREMLDSNAPLDVQAVVALISNLAAGRRLRTGEGLLLLVDEMGRFLEYAAANGRFEDPSIFQAIAERAGGRKAPDLAIVGFLHHRFADYVAGMGGWIEAEWSRTSERYEEIQFAESTEQSLFLLADALKPERQHTAPVRKKAAQLYREAVDRGLFAVPSDEVVRVSPNLYPLHPAVVAALASATRRFGQNERSLFSFLLSLEPSSLQRFAGETPYGAEHWYLLPSVMDHLIATTGERPGSDRARRWSLAIDALSVASDLSPEALDVLKAVALVALLEPQPGLVADAATIAWCLRIDKAEVQSVLEGLVERNLIYRRPHREDFSLWSRSSVDLSRWLDEARARNPVPERLEHRRAARPVVAHRHYHETGTLRTFEVRFWTGEAIGKREADGLILVVPVYPGDDRNEVLGGPVDAVEGDPLALVCARSVEKEDLKWAHELGLWTWVRDNCDELRVDDLARAEVGDRIASAERALMSATAVLSAASSVREESWWREGKSIDLPRGGLSVLLSGICDSVYCQAPILKNDLINRTRLSSAVAGARTRLLDRMLNETAHADLGMTGAPPERTIYLSLFHASGIHGEAEPGRFAFRPPPADNPCRWAPVWTRIAELLDSGEVASFAALLEALAAPPYGLRTAPALLAIVAFVLSSKENVAVMERNSFQPDLTAAHFMRLAKGPGNFALKSLREGPEQTGVIQALSTGLKSIGDCSPTIAGITEKLFVWYNGLSEHARLTTSISDEAIAVRKVLHKASEPSSLFFRDLPEVCSAKKKGGIDAKRYALVLDGALSELENAVPKVRSLALTSTLRAFDAMDAEDLRSRICSEYGPHLKKLTDHKLRGFVERALNEFTSDDRWLDGIVGHLMGRRPDKWTDDTISEFELEIQVVARNLERWLSLIGNVQGANSNLRRIHVIHSDGREDVLTVRREEENSRKKIQLNALRRVLENEPYPEQILGELLVQYTEI